MIDLKKRMSKKLISKEAILENYDDVNIYRYYIGDFEINKPFCSPLRDENNPSFSIFISKHDDQLLFKDFTLDKTGDFVVLVQLLFGLTYFEALSKIAYDFNLNKKYYCKNLNQSKIQKNENFSFINREKALSKVSSFRLNIKSRKWRIHDYKFWKQFGITRLTLIKFNVVPVEYLFINDKIIKADKHTYAFIENKDNIKTYKIYQPFNKEFKWSTNHNDSIWQGWTQLPKKHNSLVITKSLKDVMSIYEVANIPAVSLQAESVKPKLKVIEELKRRFENIIILYDNDFDSKTNWGQKLGQELSAITAITNLKIEDKYKSKDFSDLVKNKGSKIAEKEINNLINLVKLPF